MKYNQPYGISDPNGPYINGNPSTGTMGSIPPAASIEFPQREIVNVINSGGMGYYPPDNADLAQLGKSIQAGGLNYCTDAGTPNQIAVTLSPAPGAYRLGLNVYTKMKYDNYVGGPTTLNINAMGPKPVHHLDGSELTGGELKAGMMALFAYDGAAFQWISGVAGLVKGTLISNRDYYVNASTGNDAANDGLSISTPFRTIQHGIVVASAFNLNGYMVTIHVAAGTYPENVELLVLNGNGNIRLLGDPVTPANVLIMPPKGPAITSGRMFATSGYDINGFKLSGPVNGVYPDTVASGCGLRLGSGTISAFNLEFGLCADAHVFLQVGCSLSLFGYALDPVGGAKWIISGDAPCHIRQFTASTITSYSPALTINGVRNFSEAFIDVESSAIWSGRFNSIAGSVTGKKYNARMNGVINTGGSGVGYFPGSVAGTTDTGGQYV